MVISACMTQLLGWVYVLPLCLFGLLQIKFGEYLNRETLKNGLPRLVAATRMNPMDIVVWLVNTARGTQTPVAPQKGQGEMSGSPDPYSWNSFEPFPPISPQAQQQP